MESAVVLDKADPNRQKLLEIVRKIVEQCPREARGHASKLAGSILPPESEAVPRFFRNNPQATDVLEQSGALESLLG